MTRKNLAFVEAAAAAEFGITARGRVAAEQLVARPTCLRRITSTHGRGEPRCMLGSANSGDRGPADRTRSAFPAAISTRPSDTEVCLFLRHLWATDGCVWLGRGQVGSGQGILRHLEPRTRLRRRPPARPAEDRLREYGQIEKAGYRPIGYHVDRGRWPQPADLLRGALASTVGRGERGAQGARRSAGRGRTVNTNVWTRSRSAFGKTWSKTRAYPGRANRTRNSRRPSAPTTAATSPLQGLSVT